MPSRKVGFIFNLFQLKEVCSLAPSPRKNIGIEDGSLLKFFKKLFPFSFSFFKNGLNFPLNSVLRQQH